MIHQTANAAVSRPLGKGNRTSEALGYHAVDWGALWSTFSCGAARQSRKVLSAVGPFSLGCATINK